MFDVFFVVCFDLVSVSSSMGSFIKCEIFFYHVVLMKRGEKIVTNVIAQKIHIRKNPKYVYGNCLTIFMWALYSILWDVFIEKNQKSVCTLSIYCVQPNLLKLASQIEHLKLFWSVFSLFLLFIYNLEFHWCLNWNQTSMQFYDWKCWIQLNLKRKCNVGAVTFAVKIDLK